MTNGAPLIGFGQVRHTRLRPSRHAFAYSTYFLLLPMRSLKRATVDLQRAKAELALLEVDRVAGTLVELAEVQFVLADTGTLVRAELEAMPDRLASELIAFASDRAAMHAALERWASDALTRIADQLDERGERLAQG